MPTRVVGLHVLSGTAHRPWLVPVEPWAMEMRWCDLAFLHWPVHPDVLRARLPAELELDLFDSWAWIGVVPFRMEAVRLRLLPGVPTARDFLELNVRTYVHAAGRSGVWFYSLDATSRLAVRAARIGFDLPYFDAAITVAPQGDGIHYQSHRTHRGAPAAEFRASYSPIGAARTAVPGSFEHWLAERYCLFSANRRGRVASVDVHHAPWPLQPAECEVEVNTMAEAAGIRVEPCAPVAHFARRLDVLGWSPMSVSATWNGGSSPTHQRPGVAPSDSGHPYR